jgi:hypothetical protein
MSKSVERDMSARAGKSDDDVVSLLKNMQRQLLFLERKIDGLTHHLQEKQYRENSSLDRPFAKRSYPKPYSSPGHPRSRGKRQHKEKSEEKDSGRPFYSKFSKTKENSGSGSRKKPFQSKSKKRK